MKIKYFPKQFQFLFTFRLCNFLGRNPLKNFVGFLVQTKTPKSPFEMNWSLKLRLPYFSLQWDNDLKTLDLLTNHEKSQTKQVKNPCTKITKIDNNSYLPVLIILSLKWLAWCWRLPGSLHGIWPAGWWHFGSLGRLLFRGLPINKTGNMGISRSHNPLDHNSCG